jgi:uncharacterized protein (TIGR03663 family)
MYNDQYFSPTPRASVLDRRVLLNNRALEIAAYAVLFLASIVLHLWQLDAKAMHHDESIHAWISYRFFTGMGQFNCAGHNEVAGVIRQADTYCYDPVYHGPTLYFATILSYFLFGTGDAQARLPMALAGIGLVPMAWTLRSFIGRKGALLAAVLMTLSPSLLYYTRFARHDALVLLWSLFMLVGLFRFIHEGKAINLTVALAGIALTWATHELVFILLFIGGSFLFFRWLWEWKPRAFGIALALTIIAVVGYVALNVFTPADGALHSTLEKGLGPVLLLGVGALLLLPISERWEPEPIITRRLVHTWRTERHALWIAGATFLVIFALLFSTFFAYPRGFLDGWYQGIKYWLGSQHEYARGDQPWFYYLLLLPIYDLLALVFGLGGLVWLMLGTRRRPTTNARPTPRGYPVRPTSEETSAYSENDEHEVQPGVWHAELDADEHDHQVLPAPVIVGGARVYDTYQLEPRATELTEPAVTAQLIQPLSDRHPPLLVFFLGYWFVQSFVAFSWAGEKMPWLVTHISLPATLLAAWVLGELVERVPLHAWRQRAWAVPLLVIVFAVTFGVGVYTFAGGSDTVAGIAERVRGMVPLMVAGACLFGLLQIGSRIGGRVVWRVAALTAALVLGVYGVRAATLVVYRHPDTPVEPLIYTQTAPDVPVLVDQIKRIAINQTRNQRSAQDPTGGLSLALVIDGGASKHNGEGNLAWPLQWYLREFRNVDWFDVDTETIKSDARIVLLSKSHLNDAMRAQLDEDFVQTTDGIFNWWFPEYNSYDPDNPGQTVRGYKTLEQQEGALGVLRWPFTPSNWPTLGRYMMYRDLPAELKGREMVVFMHRDVVPGGVAQGTSAPTVTLAPEATLGQGQIGNARGIALDEQGNLYVADFANHRVVVLDAAGNVVRTVGSFGSGAGQLHEPSGVALDAAGNLYVADTWNARVSKFAPDGSFIKSWGSGTTPYGNPVADPATGTQVQKVATDTKGEAAANAANPLGFFGPRNVLVSNDRVYIADTGNARIVVTDLEGNFVQQWGTKGSAATQLQEPIGLGVDASGRIYVGDTWNARVQVFQSASDAIDPSPVATLPVRGWAPNTYNDPYIAVAGDGRVWASQGARNTIAEYDAAGQYVRRLRGEPALAGPKGMAVGPGGALYAVNNRQQVLRFRP